MSDAVIIQLISSAVTLLALHIHRMKGRDENMQNKDAIGEIGKTVNGRTEALLVKITDLERQINRLTGENARLNDEAHRKGNPS
jgi:hypothetical protein